MKTFSDEHRANLSAALKGRTLSSEHRAKIAVANKGRTHSSEHRAKIAEAMTGKPGRRVNNPMKAKAVDPGPSPDVRASVEEWNAFLLKGDLIPSVVIAWSGRPGDEAEGSVNCSAGMTDEDLIEELKSAIAVIRKRMRESHATP